MKHQKVLLPLACLLVTFIFVSLYPKQLQSVPPTSVKDTLSSSQLSYFARLGTGNTINDTLLKIAVTGNPSNTTNNLFVGDTIAIGTSGATTLNTYTIRDIGNTAQLEINTGVSNLASFVGNAVIATRSAIHTISFTPKTNITAGAWQFLIKASSRSGETYNDGIPDQQGFDFGQDVGSTTTGSGTRLKTADVTCPFGTASVGTTVVISSNSYNVITCDLAAGVTNPVDVGVTVTIGRALASGSQLLNPAPALSHTEGKADSTADLYSFFIRHLDGSDAIIDDDTIQGKIAVVESVRVTATVDPSLTFYIDNTGVSTGSTACSNSAFGTNAANTTATAVSFGSLSLAAFNNLAQRLSCVTNASSGYVVTVYESDQMKNISTGTTIADTNCDGACSYTAAGPWNTDNSHSEWGYTLQNLSASSVGVGTTAYKAFGEGASQAQTIMSNTAVPSATEQAYICYRLTASTVQEAGNYENQLTYTATATF